MKRKDFEVMAPVGSYESLEAALQAGANSVYFGVEGLNMRKKHTKPNAKFPQGGIIDQEAPIHISNLNVVDPKSGKGVRIGRRLNDAGKSVRYSKKSGEEIK